LNSTREDTSRVCLIRHVKRPATIDAYSRAVRQISEFFDRCPDTLSTAELKEYFANLISTRSWSTVKLGRNGLQFFLSLHLK